MQGAEYLTAAALADVWSDLDAWVRGQVASSGQGLSGFLKERAPLWHQVGRVCFSPGREPPRPGLSLCLPGDLRAEPIQRRPRAVPTAQQGAAAVRRREEPARRWSSCSRPSTWRRRGARLSRSWSTRATSTSRWRGRPREAYRFLKEVPVFEESGVLVRLPDWWKKRPRPRVGVTIGEKRQKKFDAEGDARLQGATGAGRPGTDAKPSGAS